MSVSIRHGCRSHASHQEHRKSHLVALPLPVFVDKTGAIPGPLARHVSLQHFKLGTIHHIAGKLLTTIFILDTIGEAHASHQRVQVQHAADVKIGLGHFRAIVDERHLVHRAGLQREWNVSGKQSRFSKRVKFRTAAVKSQVVALPGKPFPLLIIGQIDELKNRLRIASKPS